MGVRLTFEDWPDMGMFQKPHSMKARSFLEACRHLPFAHPHYFSWTDHNSVTYVFGLDGSLEFVDTDDGPMMRPVISGGSERFLNSLEESIAYINPRITRLGYDLKPLRNIDSSIERIVPYHDRISRPYFVFRQHPLWDEQGFFRAERYSFADVAATLPDAITAWTLFRQRVYHEFQEELGRMLDDGLAP